MTADELQRWASILRWVGLSVTAIGLLITFGSHYIADKLLVVQRADKAAAQERLKVSEAKTAELEHRLAARQFTDEQRAKFVQILATVPKGQVGLVHVTVQPETIQFVQQVRTMLIAAGYTTTEKPEYAIGYAITAPAPWFMAIVVGSGEQPPYALPIKQAFAAIGIEAPAIVGNEEISKPGQFKIYVGSKP